MILLRWLADRLGTPVAAGLPSGSIPGLEIADILSPSPTSCAVLDDGDKAELGLAFPAALLSEVQYFTRWTELSKLLRDK